MADENTPVDVATKPKKRPITGRQSEKKKQKRLSGHVTGANCNCSRLKCFEKVGENDRTYIITQFNGMQSKQEQDFFLSGLVEILPVKQRRSRNKNSNPDFHDFSYQYFVNIPKEDGIKKEYVCVQAFCAFFGITRSRIRNIRKSIAVKGKDLQRFLYMCWLLNAKS